MLKLIIFLLLLNVVLFTQRKKSKALNVVFMIVGGFTLAIVILITLVTIAIVRHPLRFNF